MTIPSITPINLHIDISFSGLHIFLLWKVRNKEVNNVFFMLIRMIIIIFRL
jgi:hypothetical protein